jgi:hypothetical protein
MSTLPSTNHCTAPLARLLRCLAGWIARVGFGSSLALYAAPASAQVNVEPIRRQLKEQGFTLQFRQSVTMRTGNTEGIELGAGTLAGLAGGRSLAYVSASADYSWQNGVTQVAKSFVHLRYNHRLFERVAAEAFSQVETDRFRRLRSRLLFGAGPRFTLVENESAELHWGTAAMLELTQRNTTVEASRRHDRSLRWSNYVAFALEAHERITASQTVYYQPRFDDFSDFWLLNVTSVVFNVTDVLASRIDVTVRREANAPANVERVDSEVVSSVELSL